MPFDDDGEEYVMEVEVVVAFKPVKETVKIYKRSNLNSVEDILKYAKSVALEGIEDKRRDGELDIAIAHATPLLK